MIKECELLEALEKNWIREAILDVFDTGNGSLNYNDFTELLDDILVYSNMCYDLILQSHYRLIILSGRTKRLQSHLTAQRCQGRKILPNVSK